ncbi:hypothetical protein CLU79DRAFT_849452 [Phycomyces nitens]|nr:hypothetical protein CLU79DRAFT_849452 [Phycomyces nitens]
MYTVFKTGALGAYCCFCFLTSLSVTISLSQGHVKSTSQKLNATAGILRTALAIPFPCGINALHPVGFYWFDGYRPAHFGVWAQQEGKHSVAYFMMDIKSEGGGEACPLLIGPWLHRCFGIHYLGNRQVVRNRMYPSPSVFDLAPADMVSI